MCKLSPVPLALLSVCTYFGLQEGLLWVIFGLVVFVGFLVWVLVFFFINFQLKWSI